MILYSVVVLKAIMTLTVNLNLLTVNEFRFTCAA